MEDFKSYLLSMRILSENKFVNRRMELIETTSQTFFLI